MENMELYNKYRAVPKEAQKTIGGGRLKGMTDINPMWRIQCLTETFGPCGIGWYTNETDHWIETAADGTMSAFVTLNLYVRDEKGNWSMGIQGTGGSKLYSKEQSGWYMNDEAYKMAETDAISVACKKLGFGADVYWQSGRTKYSQTPAEQQATAVAQPTEKELMVLEGLITKKGVNMKAVLDRYKVNALSELTGEQYVNCLKALENTR